MMVKLTLKGARANAGLTQADVAKALGVSTNTVHNWEKGASFPDIQQCNQLCELYGVDLDTLNFLPNNPLKAE